MKKQAEHEEQTETESHSHLPFPSPEEQDPAWGVSGHMVMSFTKIPFHH